MKKLELKHLAPYLPYKLKIHDTNDGLNRVMNLGEGRSNNWVGIKTVERNQKAALGYTIYKPILRPLSDLVETIYLPDISGFDVVPVEIFNDVIEGWCDAYDEWWNFQYPDFSKMMRNAPYEIIEKLIEWHFDVFGLIEEGLAIDINTIEL